VDGRDLQCELLIVVGMIGTPKISRAASAVTNAATPSTRQRIYGLAERAGLEAT
jgi:hypothetical protein